MLVDIEKLAEFSTDLLIWLQQKGLAPIESRIVLYETIGLINHLTMEGGKDGRNQPKSDEAGHKKDIAHW